MDAIEMPTIVPYVAGLATVLLVAAATYATVWVRDAPDPVNATTGVARSFTFDEGERVEKTLSWETTLGLQDDPSSYDVQVVLPYSVEVTPRDGNGTRYQLDVHVDGDRAASYHLRPGSGGVTVHQPGAHFDPTALHEGTNRVVAVANLQRTSDLAGDNDVEIGPLIVEAHPRDADGDGIADARQPIPGVPTGLVSVAAGLLAGAPTTIVTHRLQADRGREGTS